MSSITIAKSQLTYREDYKTCTYESAALKANKNSGFNISHSTALNIFHSAVEIIQKPAGKFLQCTSRVLQPCPGEGKEINCFTGLAFRVGYLALAILLLLPAIPSALITFSLRTIELKLRPEISYIDNSQNVGDAKTEKDLNPTEQNPLKVRTHNLALQLKTMNNLADTRNTNQRAQEIVNSLMGENGETSPDIMLFQEAFDEDSVKILVEGLKAKYPYIIHTVLPHLSGYSSGSFVASKYPIDNVQFDVFQHMSNPERSFAPRGITRVNLKTAEGKQIAIYEVHTQAFLGQDKAVARYNQFRQLRRKMKEDKRNNLNLHQMAVGDFNTSLINAWGHSNRFESEKIAFNYLSNEKKFINLFRKDHDEKGKRTDLQPFYLEHDNRRMGVTLQEPEATWSDGPFETQFDGAGHAQGAIARKMMKNRNQLTSKKVQIEKRFVRGLWGTPEWHKVQSAGGAHFDYCLLAPNSSLDGRSEIRRIVTPKGTQSAASDHLPLDTRIWVKTL
jgi:endonuclease/exonuclease/phosphatase family metal-dependent hydrolase